MEEKEGSSMKVMVAIDESESSYHALMWVLNNLKESMTDNPLFIFAAQPFPQYSNLIAPSLGFAHIYSPLSATADLISFRQQQNKKVSLGLLEKAKSICANRGIKADTITEAGDPKEVICSAVENYKINLLVIGNQDNGTLKRVFLGSFTNYCLQNAKCPVLVVKKWSDCKCIRY